MMRIKQGDVSVIACDTNSECSLWGVDINEDLRDEWGASYLQNWNKNISIKEELCDQGIKKKTCGAEQWARGGWKEIFMKSLLHPGSDIFWASLLGIPTIAPISSVMSHVTIMTWLVVCYSNSMLSREKCRNIFSCSLLYPQQPEQLSP